MDKKELWKVLGRDDYARKSQELKKKCDEMAKDVRDKLIELDEKKIFLACSGTTFAVVDVSYVATCRVREKILARESGSVYYLLQDIGEHDRGSLEAKNLCVEVGRVVDAVRFVSQLDKILQEISKIEDKKVADIENALKNL